MIKIKALNDDPDSSDSSDSEYQVTREAEEEGLNKLYMNALKAASDGDTDGAIELLVVLKRELETDIPKVKDVILLKRLKYVTYKNLGLLKNDLDLILDALDIDDSDFNLWITAGKKCKEKLDFLLAKYCFESAYRFNQSNYIVIDNLIDIYFVLNDLHNCVNMCLRALEIDSGFVKAAILINECVRLLPPLLKEMQDYMHFVSVDYGGDFFHEENEEYLEFGQQIVRQLTTIKSKRLKCDDEDNKNKRKKLTLHLDNAQLHTVGQIGQKIIALYDQIQREFYNICTPLDLIIENKNIYKNVTSAPNLENEILSSNEKDNDSNLKASESNCSLKSNINLLDFADKRRSCRVKSIRSAKNRECDDDQSIFDNLMDLLPESLKNNESLRLDSLDKDNSSNSASIHLIDNKHDSKSTTNEDEIVYKLLESLEKKFSLQINIFELFEVFLGHISLLKHFTIPPIFMDMYKLYRDQTELPCAILCEVGKEISLEMIWTCLTASEIKYNKNEALFLTQILNQLSEKMNTEDYRQFVIRLLVIRGTKELNNDYLFYSLDLCSCSPQYHAFFNLILPTQAVENLKLTENTDGKSYEVAASNNLLINAQYINTILEMQTVSISKLSNDKNYSEIIKLFFTKSESDLSVEDKNELCEAIVNSEMWQKGIELFENWSELSDQCIKTIYQCVDTGKRAHLRPKLATKILKCATEGKSPLPWVIIFWSFIAEGVDIKEPNTPLLKFCKMGHNFLGRKGICTAHDGEFLLCAVKVFIEHDLEEEALKCFTCLFNFPPRKQSNPLMHTSPHIDFKWSHCKEIYDYFATDDMPEFDSHARQTGITVETKELFLKILRLIPEDQQPLKQCQSITNYLNNGSNLDLQIGNYDDQSESITSTIYYLLADFHFKNKDFLKAKQFYIFDLALNINRFDSWAGLALSTNYQLDTMLIDGTSTNSEKFQRTAFSAIQSFERALQIQASNSKLWIEFGLLTYNISSIISRSIKLARMSAEISDASFFEIPNTLLDYNDMLNKSRNCFEKASSIDSENEELWLSNYMLGKVSEKKSENLLTTLEYYECADLCLFLDGAAYPKKIPYYNPPNLSIEALEIHYRIHVSILKFLFNNRKFSARMLRQLKLHLVRASRSPFVSRRTYTSSFNSTQSQRKQNAPKNCPDDLAFNEVDPQITDLLNDVVSIVAERDVKFDVNKTRKELIEMCVLGLKRCLSRYSAHYKSYYQLAIYFINYGEAQIAKSVLLGGSSNKFTPSLRFESEVGKPNASLNYVTGLFLERKPTNFYNGIWRIPVDEIERTGNFNAHMFRCTYILIRVCSMLEDYLTLSSTSIQLYKPPDLDKRYLNEPERMFLSKIAFESCFSLLKASISKPQTDKERMLEEAQMVAQNFIKNNVFSKETLHMCNMINRLQVDHKLVDR